MKPNFQLIVIIVFVLAAILGVFVFSGAIPIGDDNRPGALGTVILWGTVPSSTILPALEEYNLTNPSVSLIYEEKSSDTFDQDLLEALASGTGPDIFLLPDDLAYHYSNKIFKIPYTSYPLSAFQKNFVGAGEVFLTSTGILAFPLAVDPLVMYYNRSMLDSNGIVFPPKDWQALVDAVSVLTKKTEANQIMKSAVALGHFSNVAHAKELLSTFFMQTGNRITGEQDGVLSSLLTSNTGYDLGDILRFYTNFADPLSSVYSWNRSLPNSLDSFTAENLALYFGFASELTMLVNKNPNLNFLVAPVPQIDDASPKVTYGKVSGIAVSAFSKNLTAAFTAASELATSNFAKSFADSLGVAPARRDLLAVPGTNSFSSTFYLSALYAKSWLDPSPKDTDNIFRTMIDSVLANTLTPQNSIRESSAKLDLLFRK